MSNDSRKFIIDRLVVESVEDAEVILSHICNWAANTGSCKVEAVIEAPGFGRRKFEA